MTKPPTGTASRSKPPAPKGPAAKGPAAGKAAAPGTAGKSGGSKPSATGMKPESDGYVPFTQRLSAWWHGEAGPKIVRGQPDRKVDIAVESEPVEVARWSDIGINISGRLWGPGLSEPGGFDYWDEIVVPAGPNGAMTILALCPGLCGGLRHLVKKFDLWLTAMEDEPDLYEAAADLNRQAGMHQRIALSKVDFASLELPEKTNDLVFSREAFYRVDDKHRLLGQLTGSLKPGGHMVFTDIIAEPGDLNSPELAACKELEPGIVTAWSEDRYRKAMKEMRMEVHVLKDDSEQYNELILHGWQSLQESLARDSGLSRTFVNALMREAQIWLARSRALQAGKLQMIRIHGRRKKLRRTSQQ